MNNTPDWDHDDIPPPPPRLEQPRQGSRRMFMSPPNQRDRDVWAAERRYNDGWPYQQIADALGIKGRGAAHAYVERGRRVPDAEREKRAAAVRDTVRERLELLHEAAMEVLDRKHLTVSHGRVIMVKDEETGTETPLLDDGPVLQAIDRLLRVNESLRRFEGLDAATKVDANVTVNPQDIELVQLIQQTETANAEREAQIKGDPDGD